MDNALIEWLNQELNRRNLSARKLSKQIGKADSYVSLVLNGKMEPSVSFYTGIAEALDVPIEKILRLAGILPDNSDVDEGPLTAKELWQLANLLSPEERQEVLDFVDYLMHKRRGEAGQAPDNTAMDTTA